MDVIKIISGNNEVPPSILEEVESVIKYNYMQNYDF